ncbi:MAG: rhomboid family intramembrane serine protease [Porphyrobacter sp. IPPAS B-1204]|nr:MAG: rhomboid family intramembrane serine protease [Porphyrobacter sp. IPPAS B-1204]
MSFLQRGEPEPQAEDLFHPETYVDAAIRRQRRIPAMVLAVPMVIAFVWLMWTEGSMIGWAVSVPRLGEGQFALIVLHMFAHGGLMHIAFNLVALAALGPAVMERLGPLGLRSFAAFMVQFFGSGLGGVAVWLAINPTSEVPMLGASGAIFGLLGYLMRQPDPQDQPVPLIGPQLGRAFVEWVKLHLPLLAIFIIPVLLGGSNFGLAWEAHLGGFLAGMLLCRPIWAWSGGRPDWVPDEEASA